MQKIAKSFSDSAAEFKNVRSLTMGAMLIAIYAMSYSPVIGRIAIIPGVIEIQKLALIVIAASAMMFGPVFTGTVAVIGDLMGTLLFYGGSFFFGYTFSWFLQGIVFGLFFYKLKVSLPRITLCMLFNTCVINLLLTTKWESMMGFGTFQALFAKRLVFNIIMYPVNIIILFIALRAILALCKKAGYNIAR